MLKLNFNSYNFKIKIKDNKKFIFDIIRRKYILLTPEEWVRQHCLHHLIEELNIPASLIQVEKAISTGNTKGRFDIIAFNPDGTVYLLVECKAVHVEINQSVFDQIARYALNMKNSYLMVTNGLSHYFCQIDNEQKQYLFLKQIPNYQEQKR